MVRIRNEKADVRKLDKPLFSFLSALSRGAILRQAMVEAALDEAALRDALRIHFCRRTGDVDRAARVTCGAWANLQRSPRTSHWLKEQRVGTSS